MGILKELCQDIFSIKNLYDGNFKFKIIRILGIKFTKSLGYKTNGKNNRIYIIENSEKKELKKRIFGLCINISGNNNEILLDASGKFNNCRILIDGNASSVVISASVELNNTEFVLLDNSKICLGTGVTIGGARISCWSENSCINIGDDCMLSWDVHIMNGDGHKITRPDNSTPINKGEFCEIGNHVWIGQHACICKNVKIANNNIVGTHSVVTKSVEETNVAIAGNPAKIVSKNVEWHRESRF